MTGNGSKLGEHGRPADSQSATGRPMLTATLGAACILLGHPGHARGVWRDQRQRLPPVCAGALPVLVPLAVLEQHADSDRGSWPAGCPR